ncbi:MFS transporter [Jiangella alba]|uniref:Major Facilitator Superfamily protein n=1 Tax=Jiangella alba TaxID=561176 RepID=A0A1H5D792_9ACTN|nr:MFS transporter [Jiangella alba]SED74692.1 Major Facilitator Superfamily protein [Jiangella alba]
MTQTVAARPTSRRSPGRVHRAWWVALVAFVALVGAAAFRATPSVMIEPFRDEFGWSHGTISFAISVNIMLYGLTSPFAAALMERFGMRRVVACALTLVSVGSGLTVFMTASWQLVLCWGLLVGLGTGSMALAFVATVTDRWFVARRGLVSGILTAGTATGQLVFLPLLAVLVSDHGWRPASLLVSGVALAAVPLIWFLLRDHPSDVGLLPYGAPEPGSDVGAASASATPATSASATPAAPDPTTPATRASAAPLTPAAPDLTTPATPTSAAPLTPAASPVAPSSASPASGAGRRAITALTTAARTKAFWLLAGTFAICGASTNGLVGTHFVPAAHDHGMPVTTAAGLLAVIGIFDLIGTVASGWLTDRFDPRLLLGVYYALRGVSLMVLPLLLAGEVHPPMLFFIVFYGLDWVATVPPTIALCREHFGASGPIVFGWVLASHQIGAALVAFGAGLTRDAYGSYDLAWIGAGALCAMAAAMALAIRRRAPRPPIPTTA